MATTENLSEWRGKELLDSDGEKIGKLLDIYVDGDTDEPQFGSVKEGLFGKHLTFVPLIGATVAPDSLKINATKAQVKDAPNIETDGELTGDQESDLYRHYGLDYQPLPTPSGRRLARR